MKPQEKSKEKEDNHSLLPISRSIMYSDKTVDIVNSNGIVVMTIQPKAVGSYSIVAFLDFLDLIVTAVNSHERLVDMLGTTMQLIDKLMEIGGFGNDADLQMLRNSIRSTIADAKGK